MASGEFDLIQRYFQSPTKRTDVLLGIGDDCAITSIPAGKRLAITTDTLIDGVHFPPRTAPDDIAVKAVAVNLSDLAAIGATPAWLTLALSMPHVDQRWINSFADAFKRMAGRFDAELIGGDTCQGPLSVTVQALGLIDDERSMRRDRAQPGDVIYVSGTLGDAAAGLKILQRSPIVGDDEAWLVNRLNRPEPRVELGVRVAEFCRCAIDISDGLVADLGHVLAASQCGATVYKDRIPLSRQLIAHAGGRDALDWDLVLAGGDDYELCLVVAPDKDNELMRLSSELVLPLTRIGVIVEQRSLRIVDSSGAEYLVDQSGYQHFVS